MLNGVHLPSTMHDDEFFRALFYAFKDVGHSDNVRQKLAKCRQQTTVQTYIDEFRNSVLELGSSAPDDATLLFNFVSGLK